MSRVQINNVLDVVLGAQEDGTAVVDGGGLHVEDWLPARAGETTGILDEVRHGIAFVEETELDGDEDGSEGRR